MSHHRVAVVVDKCFGEQLISLSKEMHVWCCDTPPNREAALKISRSRNNEHHLDFGVTTFKFDNSASPEHVIGDVLPVVDEHHYGWRSIAVYGCPATSNLLRVFQHFDATLEEREGGFVARKMT